MSFTALHRRLARGEPRRSDRIAEGFLTPLAILYGLGAAARNLLYDRRLLPRARAGVPVISIGSLSAGGTGKTPLAAEVARLLLAWGHRPLLVARGYGARRGSGQPRMLAPVAGGAVGSGRAALGWQDVGEEALLLARLAPGVPVAVARRREAALAVAREAGCDPDVLVLDGAFQYRRLEADFQIVTVDASRRPGSGRLLPLGDLREPWRNLARADFLILHRAERCAEPDAWKRFLGRHAPEVPVARTGNRWGRPYRVPDGASLDWPEAGRRSWGVWLALADPRPFLDELAARGIRPLWIECARDHAPFSSATRARIAARHCDGILVSEKDAIKVEAHAHALPPVYAVAAELQLMEGRELFEERLKGALGPIPSSRRSGSGTSPRP
ncbi:MAG: tetraacyldisaccharide 4'-kinase [Candidatus Eisenbacteria bacterium]